MKGPTWEDGCCSEVSLSIRAEEQLALLKTLVVGQQVVFSGTIGSVNSGGVVELLNSELAPLK